MKLPHHEIIKSCSLPLLKKEEKVCEEAPGPEDNMASPPPPPEALRQVGSLFLLLTDVMEVGAFNQPVCCSTFWTKDLHQLRGSPRRHRGVLDAGGEGRSGPLHPQLLHHHPAALRGRWIQAEGGAHRDSRGRPRPLVLLADLLLLDSVVGMAPFNSSIYSNSFLTTLIDK